jgi:hypothetical protein
MNVEIKKLHSPDVWNLESFQPEEDCFGFLLQLIVGLKGVESEESFDTPVCTPKVVK